MKFNSPLTRHILLAAALAVALAACNPTSDQPSPEAITAQPQATTQPEASPEPPATEEAPASATPGPTSSPAPTIAPTQAPTNQPVIEPTEEPMGPMQWFGLVPPFTPAQLCEILTLDEVNAILEWEWEPAYQTDASGCVYGTVELHTGALVRLNNTKIQEEEFLGYYPSAMFFEGILLADAYGRGRLDDIWIEMTGIDNLSLSIFATPITEEQSLQLVEAVYPSPYLR